MVERGKLQRIVFTGGSEEGGVTILSAKFEVPEHVERCINAVRDKKAVEVVLFHVHDLSSVTDYFLLCSGGSSKQVQAIADNVEEAMRKMGERYLGCEGYQEGRWILMDYHDLVVHVFHRETRTYYDLERLWGTAPRWDDERQEGLGTLQESG